MKCFGFEFEGEMFIMYTRLGNDREVSLGVMDKMVPYPIPVPNESNLQVTITVAQARSRFQIVMIADSGLTQRYSTYKMTKG